MIDTHIHLSHKHFDQTFPYIDFDGKEFKIVSDGRREALIGEMKRRGVSCCLEPAIDVDSNERLLDLSKESGGFVYPAVGNHPARCIHSKLRDFKRVRNFSERDGVIAIGETGLDYHFERREQHRLKQKIWFQFQINLADKLGLPLILHIRQADKDAVRILRRNRKKLHGSVCHCFSGGADIARVYTEELGFCLGIGGTMLMKPEYREQLEQAVIATPIECLLLETDGPYVKPEKPDAFTGKKWTKARNTSLILPAVAERIAEFKGMDAVDVIRITEENARRVFGLMAQKEMREECLD